jgi:KDO2-lipid IV(A) lauroyltransferase
MGAAWLAAWELTRRLPEPAAFALADRAGTAMHRLASQTRAVVGDNLRPVKAALGTPGELDELVAAAFRSYARYWAEAFRAADLGPGELDRRTETSGFAHLDAALDRGRGVVVLLGHHGSWDVAAQWAETHGYHLAVVAEVVRPRWLFARFVRLRETVGLEVVPLRRGEELYGRLEEVLAANHLVGLLADRDVSGSGPEVELFGERTRLPQGPVALAHRCGAPIVPITMLQRPGRGWHLQVMPAIEAAEMSFEEAMDAVAAGIEGIVATDPVQWHAFQPIWPP